MRQFAREDVREDFGIAVRVCGKAGLGRDAVFVQDAQGAEGLEGWVLVLGEGEGMVGVKPAVIGVAAVAASARGNLHGFGCGGDDCFGCGHGGMMLKWGVNRRFQELMTLLFQTKKNREKGLKETLYRHDRKC